MIELQYKKGITSPLHRCMVLIMLLCSFALGVKAQPSWWPEGTHATGIENGVVYLNDLEDHNWTYYSGVDGSVDNGYYNNNYNGILYSPNPRNVKITYKGRDTEDNKTSNVKVSIDAGEDQHTFVYYKTLEEGSTEGEYPYTVISNPFSVRPSVEINGTKTYYGFNGWKIVSGHQYIKRANGTPAEENATLGLDEEITFVGLDNNYTKNCISANIELQATWVPLDIVRLTTYTAKESYIYSADGGTYETNILVLQTDLTQHIVANSPCTVMMVEPDGSDDYRDNYTFDKLLRPAEGVNNRTKIEYVHWQPSGAINARGRNFTIGRGIVMDENVTTRALYGTNTASTDEEPLVVNQILKVESGKFTQFIHYGQLPKSITKQWVTLGCDYDRAKSYNDKLEFTSDLRVATEKTLPTTLDSEIFRTYSLSGRFVTEAEEDDVKAATAASCYYLSVRNGADQVLGHRYLEILGGEWKNLAGGWAPQQDPERRSLTIRMKGGNIKGSIYGGAQHVNASGIVTYIITGGTINGWVAGGANGTATENGMLDGKSFIYIGGNVSVDSNPESIETSNTIINRAVGGNVFGAGCGYSATSTSGQVTLGTNVVIADNAYVERGVYGGGSYGYCPTDKTANIYITGGTVDGKAGGVDGTDYMDNIQGGIYGGACQNKGGSVNIFMTGGTINGGLYGGSNASGALSGNVNITIAGGNIGGTQENAASVFGGGYGSGTTINGSTNITMTGGTINGNLFGGGNQGAVNLNTSVTITGGSVTGNVYGGGNQAAVSGTTNVVIGKADK